MKRFLITSILAFSLSAFCRGQQTFEIKKVIDGQTLLIDSNIEVIKCLFTDSSKVHDSYTEIYFKNRKSSKISKVEYVHIAPYAKITYYFFDNKLIKLKMIDKSTSIGIYGNFYFKERKLIYASHRNVDGDNNCVLVLKKADNYIKKFYEHIQ